ncbi:hypothetical protein M514_02984 [Trichuris suis]|uniref:Uncharacterized protein n=1 Tax=Trichuris suis TaxID=68888 RepID=A0A085NI39_9BILA|nr:hypothetical protein M513_02984 [Trichuris suis]KFD69135.1 hypothetical protein M514_02984 [Trichuris suis]
MLKHFVNLIWADPGDGSAFKLEKPSRGVEAWNQKLVDNCMETFFLETSKKPMRFAKHSGDVPAGDCFSQLSCKCQISQVTAL